MLDAVFRIYVHVHVLALDVGIGGKGKGRKRKSRAGKRDRRGMERERDEAGRGWQLQLIATCTCPLTQGVYSERQGRAFGYMGLGSGSEVVAWPNRCELSGAVPRKRVGWGKYTNTNVMIFFDAETYLYHWCSFGCKVVVECGGSGSNQNDGVHQMNGPWQSKIPRSCEH